MNSKIAIFLFGIFVSSFAYKSYENFKVYKVIPKSDVQIQILTDLRKNGSYDFWTDILTVNNEVRILVSPDQEVEFVKYLKSVDLTAEISIKNVQELIEAQLKPSASSKSSQLGSFTWNEYHNLARIHSWLDELQESFPNVVKTVVIGQSVEGHDIKGVIIDFKPGARGDKPLIGMLEGGIHAREWISPATVTWIIKEFLTSNDPDIRFMAETLVWHIFPVANPDGYMYTFTNDRMWRKNRNTANYVTCGNNIEIGNGIDLNRNFDFLWMSVGASSNPCDNTYAGPTPSSELETQAIINYVNQLRVSGNMIYYIAFHSWSQMILVPYSHATGVQVLEASNYADMYEIAIRGAAKLESVHGTQYTVGTSAEILYAVSGSSFDWVKGVADIPIVYLFELRDVGQFGFLLPAEQIIPNNEEVMAGLVEMEKTARGLGYYSGAGDVKSVLLFNLIALVFALLR
ncbi:unnamed protein product [Diatraea saccharalis]|uniref:Zinc carboxypeptidase A 1 n=1 Tax=Diatraea saccharalis TaxID=40085 RepID=A0A9N9WF95_9NEOP|nr:unnamed protein product [Diatraea saccharalis]